MRAQPVESPQRQQQLPWWSTVEGALKRRRRRARKELFSMRLFVQQFTEWRKASRVSQLQCAKDMRGFELDRAARGIDAAPSSKMIQQTLSHFENFTYTLPYMKSLQRRIENWLQFRVDRHCYCDRDKEREEREEQEETDDDDDDDDNDDEDDSDSDCDKYCGSGLQYRAFFSLDERQALNEYFKRVKYPTNMEVQALASRFNKRDVIVRRWFKTRRAKARRDDASLATTAGQAVVAPAFAAAVNETKATTKMTAEASATSGRLALAATFDIVPLAATFQKAYDNVQRAVSNASNAAWTTREKNWVVLGEEENNEKRPTKEASEKK